jgi:hypothetical protein
MLLIARYTPRILLKSNVYPDSALLRTTPSKSDALWTCPSSATELPFTVTTLASICPIERLAVDVTLISWNVAVSALIEPNVADDADNSFKMVEPDMVTPPNSALDADIDANVAVPFSIELEVMPEMTSDNPDISATL